MIRATLLLTTLIFLHCANPQPMDKELWIEEVHSVETAFSEMAAEAGVPAAFLAFAADEAVLNRNNRIIKGKAAIRDYFDQQTLQEVQLSWTPEFIDVADDGTMAYTYGPYTFSARDTAGTTIQSSGIFHTVWKRQADGSWKYVYD